MNILNQILSNKKQEIKRKKEKVSLDELAKKVSTSGSKKIDFKSAILNPKFGDISLIAEIKLASPSAGVLGKEEEVLEKVKQYEQFGAEAISIVVDQKFFNGSLDLIPKIKEVTRLPILAKDFILDPYQIYEISSFGADAVLLIAKIIDQSLLKELVDLSFKLNLQPVVEVNNKQELNQALNTNSKLIAVNSRDLGSLEVNIESAAELGQQIPKDRVFLAFSGVKNREEVLAYKEAGAKAVLVGTTLMQAKNIEEKIKELKGIKRFTLVKICGIRSLEAAKTALDSGADFLGFNFVKTSIRYIDPKKAKGIIDQVKGKIKIVGVFQNSPLEEINDLAESLALDFAQLHGEEDIDYVRGVKLPVIKVFSLPEDFSIEGVKKEMGKIKAKYFMIDRETQGQGQIPNLEKIKGLTNNFSIILAGGLTPENVAEVVSITNPLGVDVASGIETDGKQDLEKIKQFIKNAKGGRISV